MKKNQSGFTLVELMVIVAILAVLVAIGIAIFANARDKAAETTCQSIRYNVLRVHHQLYALDQTITIEDVLANEGNAYFDIAPTCPDGGVLSIEDGVVTCSIHGASFIDIASSASYRYDFSQLTEEELNALLDLIITQSNDDWSVEEVDGKLVLTNLTNGENRIFFPIEFDNYKLISNITLDGNNGYGIMIDSVSDDFANDSGYIFQFDPGYGDGEFIFRVREDGRELSPFARIDPADVIPDYDPDTFWNDPHEVVVEVVDYSDDKKQMVVYIDGIDITIEEPILMDKSDDTDQNYVGFRTWGSSSALIDDLEILSYGD